jgi:hypothetical protein
MKQEGLFNYRKLTDEELASYKEQGFLVIKGILKQEGVAQIQRECMTAWDKKKRDLIPIKAGCKIRCW